jgi:hypothetical protein
MLLRAALAKLRLAMALIALDVQWRGEEERNRERGRLHCNDFSMATEERKKAGLVVMRARSA